MMNKRLLLAMVILGLTFIYNSSMDTGFVFVNNSASNAIILVDPSTNSLNFYEGNFAGTQRADQGIEKWLDSMMKGGWNFKSSIIPYTQKQGITY